VRELIRRRGLDPFTDPGPVRLLVRDVVADYSERSPTSALPPIGDPDAVVRDVLDRVAGFGPLQRWLDDPEVEEIWIKDVCRRGVSLHHGPAPAVNGQAPPAPSARSHRQGPLQRARTAPTSQREAAHITVHPTSPGM